MSKIYKSVDMLIGKTPLMELGNIEKELGINARILAKLEYLNPAGSVKDRVALKMIDAAERDGKLKSGGVIIEPTSGNTGIGIASVAAARGYSAIIVMPDTMSVERIRTMKAYGAQVVLTPGSEGMAGAVKKAEEICGETPGSIIAGQFENPSNPQAHFETTGPELYEDTDGAIDIFVSAVGTGGTISGTGKYLKSQNPDIKIVAVEPADSPLLSEGKSAPHKIQGIGANFIPKCLDTGIYDEIIKVTTEEAYTYARMAGKKEGILVGISSGAALSAAVALAKREENKGKSIAVILPDSGDRYLSTELFE